MKMTKLKVIPMPKEVIGEMADGSFEYVGISVAISADEYFLEAADTFAELVKKIHGAELESSKGGIALILDASLASGEYRIEADENGARAFAADSEGISYALSTLLQLASYDGGAIQLPKVKIFDKPDCGYRTFMVDLARQWHSFDTLLGYVDLCYLYKIKYLHLHFIDTQSYTLPSDKFPKMPTDGRHYSFEEIEKLNAYAASRGIELIPEVELPGHAKSMVSAYPELFANTLEVEEFTDKYSLFNNNSKGNIICVGKEGMLDTVEELLREVIAMFPNSKYIHIGGDEATIAEWEVCTDCKRYMKKKRIDGVKSLYSHFVKLVTDLVLSLGKTPIVWEGFPREGSEDISRDVLVIAWESYYNLAPDLVADGFKIINASWKPLYIVPWSRWGGDPWCAKDVLEWNIYNWQNWNKKSPAHLNPINIQPTDSVLGAQLCAWECTYEREIDEVREKLAALSERTWNIRRYAEDEEFKEKLDAVLPIARALTAL